MISIHNLTKSFDQQMVMKDFNLEFQDGSVTCIMGPSGVGKTTLIHIILGLVKPDSGLITGIEDCRMAAVFQEDRLCENMDAVKNIQLVTDLSEQAIHREFERVGLTEYEGKPVSELSGGMKRRVAIARAMIIEPDIIIMDEPFKGLDDYLKFMVMEYIKEKIKNKIAIIVTHDIKDIKSLEAIPLFLE